MNFDSLGDWERTHDCCTLGSDYTGAEVILMGWVQRRRDHGGLIFIDLRDRAGITQVVFDPQRNAEAHQRAHALRPEHVIGVRGEVRFRPEGMTNPKLKTGEIEVIVDEYRLFNTSLTPPFQVEPEVDAGENLRLRYRFLDLRRPNIFQNLRTRHNAAQATDETAGQIGRDHIVPFLVRHAAHQLVTRDSGIIDQDIQPAVVFFGTGHGSCCGRPVGEVTRDRLADAANGFDLLNGVGQLVGIAGHT